MQIKDIPRSKYVTSHERMLALGFVRHPDGASLYTNSKFPELLFKRCTSLEMAIMVGGVAVMRGAGEIDIVCDIDTNRLRNFHVPKIGVELVIAADRGRVGQINGYDGTYNWLGQPGQVVYAGDWAGADNSSSVEVVGVVTPCLIRGQYRTSYATKAYAISLETDGTAMWSNIPAGKSAAPMEYGALLQMRVIPHSTDVRSFVQSRIGYLANLYPKDIARKMYDAMWANLSAVPQEPSCVTLCYVRSGRVGYPAEQTFGTRVGFVPRNLLAAQGSIHHRASLKTYRLPDTNLTNQTDTFHQYVDAGFTSKTPGILRNVRLSSSVKWEDIRSKIEFMGMGFDSSKLLHDFTPGVGATDFGQGVTKIDGVGGQANKFDTWDNRPLSDDMVSVIEFPSAPAYRDSMYECMRLTALAEGVVGKTKVRERIEDQVFPFLGMGQSFGDALSTVRDRGGTPVFVNTGTAGAPVYAEAFLVEEGEQIEFGSIDGYATYFARIAGRTGGVYSAWCARSPSKWQFTWVDQTVEGPDGEFIEVQTSLGTDRLTVRAKDGQLGPTGSCPVYVKDGDSYRLLHTLGVDKTGIIISADPVMNIPVFAGSTSGTVGMRKGAVVLETSEASGTIQAPAVEFKITVQFPSGRKFEKYVKVDDVGPVTMVRNATGVLVKCGKEEVQVIENELPIGSTTWNGLVYGAGDPRLLCIVSAY